VGRRRHKPEEEAERDTSTVARSGSTPDVEEIQRLQQTAGNAAVSAMIARQDFQLQTPGIGGGGGYRPNAGLGVPQLHLDPEIQAQAQAYVRENLTAVNVLDAIRNIPPSVVAAPPAAANPLQQPAQPNQQQQRPPDPAPPPGQEKQPEPASVGTLLGAITEVPEVQQAIADLQQRTWGQLSTGGKVGVISTTVGLGLGSLALPQGRALAGSILNMADGKPIPVPGLSGLSIEFTGKDGNHGFGLHLDVGRFLPSSLGFGPAGAGDPAQPLFGGR
jgi:hypothetical protein